VNPSIPGVGSDLLDEIVRDGARRMLAAALEAEVAAYVDQFTDQVDEDGRRLVVRNGRHRARQVTTAAGAVDVHALRVNDRRSDPVTGKRTRFASAILPAWSRKSPKVAEVLPLLYLHGLSTGDFTDALEQFLGSGAGLSSSTISRLTAQWSGECQSFHDRDLSGTDYVYCWVDGIHVKVRLEQEKLCLLVMIGVRADGRKEPVTLADGFRESAESWADLLRDANRRGMAAPVLAVGDGARPRCARCSPPPGSSAAPGTPAATSWRRCRSPRIRAPSVPWVRSSTPRTRPTPWPRRRTSL
jgi:transposase-like protein